MPQPTSPAGAAPWPRQWLIQRTAGWVCTWDEYLAGGDGHETARLLRRRESTGRPLGDQTFVEKLAALLGRDLTPKKPGRKRRAKK